MMAKLDTRCGVFIQATQSFCKISFIEASAQKKLLILAVRNIPSNSSTSDTHTSCDNGIQTSSLQLCWDGTEQCLGLSRWDSSTKKLTNCPHLLSNFHEISPNTAYIKTARFWVITQRAVVISYRHFGTTYSPIFRGQDSKARTVFDSLPLKMAGFSSRSV